MNEEEMHRRVHDIRGRLSKTSIVLNLIVDMIERGAEIPENVLDTAKRIVAENSEK